MVRNRPQLPSVLLGLLLFSLTGPLTRAAQPDCPLLAQRWRDHYRRDFGIESATDFGCPGTWETALAESLYLLETADRDSGRDGIRPEFYDDLRVVVESTVFDPDCKVLARAQRGAGELTICPPFLKQSLVDRAATLVHEGRHLQADPIAHVACTQGPYRGQASACDAVFTFARDAGAYSADIFFLSWLDRLSHLSAAERDEVQRAIDAIFPARFNRIPPVEVARFRDLRTR